MKCGYGVISALEYG